MEPEDNRYLLRRHQEKTEKGKLYEEARKNKRQTASIEEQTEEVEMVEEEEEIPVEWEEERSLAEEEKILGKMLEGGDSPDRRTQGEHNPPWLQMLVNQIAEGQKKMEEVQKKVEEGQREMRKKMEEGQQEMRKKMEEVQKKVEEGQQEMRKKMEEGQKKSEEGQKKLEEGQKKSEEGQRKLEEGQKKLESGLMRMEHNMLELKGEMTNQIEEVRSKMNKNVAELNTQTGNIRKKIERLEHEVVGNIKQDVKDNQERTEGKINALENITEMQQEYIGKVHEEVGKLGKEQERQNTITRTECTSGKERLHEKLKQQEEQIKITKEEVEEVAMKLSEIQKTKETIGGPQEIYVNCEGSIGLENKHIRFNGKDRNPIEFLKRCHQHWKLLKNRRRNGTEYTLPNWLDQCMEGAAAQWWRMIRQEEMEWDEFEDRFICKFWNSDIQKGIKRRVELEHFHKGTTHQTRAEYFVERVLILKNLRPPMDEKEIVQMLCEQFEETTQTARRVQNINDIQQFEDLLSREDLEEDNNRIRRREEERRTSADRPKYTDSTRRNEDKPYPPKEQKNNSYNYNRPPPRPSNFYNPPHQSHPPFRPPRFPNPPYQPYPPRPPHQNPQPNPISHYHSPPLNPPCQIITGSRTPNRRNPPPVNESRTSPTRSPNRTQDNHTSTSTTRPGTSNRDPYVSTNQAEN